MKINVLEIQFGTTVFEINLMGFLKKKRSDSIERLNFLNLWQICGVLNEVEWTKKMGRIGVNSHRDDYLCWEE